MNISSFFCSVMLIGILYVFQGLCTAKGAFFYREIAICQSMEFESGNSKCKKSIFSSILKVVQKFMKNLGRRQRKQNDSKLRDELLLVEKEACNYVSKGHVCG